jgi:hypothetical protein
MTCRLVLRLAFALPVMAAAQACYNYVPLESTPTVGERMSFEITDRGRVDLSNRFGPGLASIEGRLLESEPNEYVIDVFRVSQVSGSSAIWSGEQTRVNRSLVATVRKRELSKVRTGLLVAGVAAGAVAIAARGMGGSYSAQNDSTPARTPISVRIPFRIPLRFPLGR